MVRAVLSIDISGMPELARLAHEVARSGKPRTLCESGAEIAVLCPARPRRHRRKVLTSEQREAVLASVGSWVGLVDPERLKRELKEARSDNRPPVEL